MHIFLINENNLQNRETSCFCDWPNFNTSPHLYGNVDDGFLHQIRPYTPLFVCKMYSWVTNYRHVSWWLCGNKSHLGIFPDRPKTYDRCYSSVPFISHKDEQCLINGSITSWDRCNPHSPEKGRDVIWFSRHR